MKRLKATVIKIIPRHEYQDGIVTRWAAEVVEVKDQKGGVHFLVTGSINGCPSDLKKVGQKGHLEVRTTSRYSLPFFVR